MSYERHTADHLQVDDDGNGRFVLLIRTDDGNRLEIDIHDDVLGFYDEVRRQIGPYAAEAEDARRTMPKLIHNRPVSVEDAVEAGYALDDPKSPGYHDRMVGDN